MAGKNAHHRIIDGCTPPSCGMGEVPTVEGFTGTVSVSAGGHVMVAIRFEVNGVQTLPPRMVEAGYVQVTV